MQKLSKVATKNDINQMRSLIESFSSSDSESEKEQDNMVGSRKQNDKSSFKKRKAYDWDGEDSTDDIEFEKMMSSHIFSFRPSSLLDISYICHCSLETCESPLLMRRLFTYTKDLLPSLSGNEEFNFISRYFKKEVRGVPRCLFNNIFLICCKPRSVENRSLQLAASTFLLMVINQENRNYVSIHPSSWLLPPHILQDYLFQLGADGLLCLNAKGAARTKRVKDSLVVEPSLIWSLEFLIKIVSLSFAPAIWIERCNHIQKERHHIREMEIVQLRETLSQTLRIILLISVDAIAGKESLKYLCYPCVDNILRVVSLVHHALPDIGLNQAVEELLQSVIASTEISHVELAKLSYFLHGCGECFLWPYCRSLFRLRLIPSFYPSQLLDIDGDTTTNTTTATATATAMDVAMADDGGDELTIILAVTIAVEKMADYSVGNGFSGDETEKTFSFFYTLLACIQVMESKAVSQELGSSSEGGGRRRWKFEDVKKLSDNCLRCSHLARRMESDEYMEQALVVLECVVFYLGSIADYLEKRV